MSFVRPDSLSNSATSINIINPTPNGGDFIDPSSNMIVMNGYNGFTTLTSTTQPEIVTIIQQLGIELEVIAKAVEIFYKINSMKINDSRGTSIDISRRTKSVKGSRKIRLTFYCVFMAYSELGFPVDPSFAADIVGLPYNEIEQAFSEYAPPGVLSIEPEKMVRFYIKRINTIIAHSGINYNVDTVNKEVERIIEICRSTPVGKEWIQNTAAKIVAIASLYFYMNDLKGYNISKETTIFEQACYLSWACIRRYHEQVAKYYNYDIEESQNVKKPKICIPYLS